MKLLKKYEAQAEEFVKVCHKLAQNLYVTSSGGNLAWRLEDNLLLITPTKLYKGDIDLKDLVFIDLDGKVVEGKRRPTGETPMYLKFFNLRQDIVSVIHCHAPNVGAMAISKEKNWLMRPIYPETTIEVGPVPLVPYAEPITEKLAEQFRAVPTQIRQLYYGKSRVGDHVPRWHHRDLDARRTVGNERQVHPARVASGRDQGTGSAGCL